MTGTIGRSRDVRAIALVGALAGLMALPGCGRDITRPGTERPLGAPDSVVEIRLTRDSLSLLVLGEAWLEASPRAASGAVVPDAEITWSSQNTSVAAVQGGRVVGVGPGATDVVAQAQGVTATAGIRVVHRNIVAWETPDRVEVGEGYEVNPRPIPIDMEGNRLPLYPMEWATADDAVAEVVLPGVVRGVAEGETILIVRAANGTATIPLIVEPGFASVIPSRYHTCALRTDGRAYCWGENEAERPRLGTGETATVTHTVPQLVAGGVRFAQLSVGEHHVCGVSVDFEAYCWGSGATGALGHGSLQRAAEPVRVVGDVSFAMVTTGEEYTCAITPGGDAYCWGSNLSGVLGQHPTVSQALEPVPVMEQRHYFLTITSGSGMRSCGMPLAGLMYCWGSTELFEPAEPELCLDGVCYVPVQVEGARPFARLQAAYHHACGVDFEGWTHCWGVSQRAAQPLGLRLDALGETGAANMMCGTKDQRGVCWSWLEPRTGPTELAGGLRLTRLAAGWHRACGVTAEGLAHCWTDPLGGGQPARIPRPES